MPISAKNRSDARDEVRRLLQTVGTTGFPDDEVNDYIGEAIKDMYYDGIAKNPWGFPMSTNTVDVVADELSADLTGADWTNTQEYDLHLVSRLPRVAAQSITNRPYPIRWVPFEDRDILPGSQGHWDGVPGFVTGPTFTGGSTTFWTG